jgi:GTPase SAR1 family protein
MEGKIKVTLFDKDYDAQILQPMDYEVCVLYNADSVIGADNGFKKFLITFANEKDANRFKSENEILSDAQIRYLNMADNIDSSYLLICYEDTRLEDNELINLMVKYAEDHFGFIKNEPDIEDDLFKLTMEQISSYNILPNEAVAKNLTELICGYTHIFESIMNEISASDNQELIDKIRSTLNVNLV